MIDPYKRSSNGQFSKVAQANLAAATEITDLLEAKKIDAEARTELTRKLVVGGFATTAARALANKEALTTSTLVGAKATPAAIATVIGSLAGKNIAGDKGQAIGQVLGATLGGALTGGVGGAVASGIASTISLDAKARKLLIHTDLKRENKLEIKPADSAGVKLVKTELEKASSSLEKQKKILQREVDKLTSEIERQGLTESVDMTIRTGIGSTVKGAITGGIASEGVAVASKMAAGAIGGLPGAAMALGIAGGGALGAKVGGKDGEVIGKVLGGSLAAGVAAGLATGGVGALPAAVVGGLSGLVSSNPNDVISTGSKLKEPIDSLAKQLAKAANSITPPVS